MYEAVSGDTFASIARKEYGDDLGAERIRKANPGVTEPLAAGTRLAIPVDPDAPKDQPQRSPSAGASDVAVFIDSDRFRFWQEVTITRSLDTFDTLSLSAPFEPDAPGFRERFRPFSYKSLNATVGGLPFMTGTMIDPIPSLDPKSNTVQVSAYSRPGVLNDANISASAYPAEFNGQDLRAITRTLLEPFGLDFVFEGAAGPGAVFERVALEPGKKILAFLIELAKQRNLVIGSTTSGQLVYRQSISEGIPVASLKLGLSPLQGAAPQFNPQEFYSSITGLEKVFLGLKGAQYTVRNPLLDSDVRPHTFTVDDTNAGDLQRVVEAKAGRMYANAISYDFPVSTWQDQSGRLWEPNTFVQVEAPRAMIYSPYMFLIRSILFNRKANGGETAVLNCVLPGAFEGKIPEVLPWD